MIAKSSLGCFNRVCDALLCPQHEARYCGQNIKADDEEDEICYFDCCSDCLQTHTCGDDPSDYC
jgi:hypothetical protein